MSPEIAWSSVLEAVPKDPRAGGSAASSTAGRGGAGLDALFLTTIGGAFASGGVLITVFDATMEVIFFAAGGCASFVERVMSGPCSTGSALAELSGWEVADVEGALCAGSAEGGTAAGVDC